MRSTYDRRGGNEGADASHFLYQLSDTDNVTLDVAGTGVLYFVRYNHWHGSPWHYVVDGSDYPVSESTTADPLKPVADSVFLPTPAFPSPLAVTWTATRGADLSWVPVGFEKSFRMGYSRTHYGTGYYIYDLYVPGSRLSQPIRRWTTETVPDQDVLALINRAGSDIEPMKNFKEESGLMTVSDEMQNFVTITNAPATLRKLSFTAPQEEALAFGRSRLRITWDKRRLPSIDAPVALFFGAGTLYNRDGREYLVKAFPSSVRCRARGVELDCYFPMPFFSSARLELLGPAGDKITNVAWRVNYEPLKAQPAEVGYFHATYRDFPMPERGQDLVLLDTREAEDGGDWSGSFVGTSFIFSDRANLTTLEGDPRFFFDDSRTPQAYGTGTEEWAGGGDYWGGLNMTLPFAGHPTGARSAKTAVNSEDKIESAYRFLLGDLMPFGRNAVIRLEHGGTDESTEHYQTVAYWYGAPAASLVKTDELKIGDGASESAHRYVSPQASPPYEITSRYEWGVDSAQNENGSGRVEIYPAETDSGRKTTGTSEFDLKLAPNNFGVLLRRKLDYSFPNQRAEIFIAESTNGDWKPAGIWYLAGANTCVYSNPKGELGAGEHVVETSNRRFREDEFLVPKDLTAGRASIRVRVKFIPVQISLYPGRPFGELAWSEIRYDAYCFVMPKRTPGQ
ncbi:MAG TPA: DUF2961 domain-containing protein [Verrucomicrobiae bacterium]|nr:DUF2961 domain-containing protein [Verrucomicrobiae bacterium]